MVLTKRQKEVLDFLVGFSNKQGYSPSFEEIAKALKLTSLATVHKHISTLERKGFIRRGYNQSRSIEVTQLPKSVREQVLDQVLKIWGKSESNIYCVGRSGAIYNYIGSNWQKIESGTDLDIYDIWVAQPPNSPSRPKIQPGIYVSEI